MIDDSRLHTVAGVFARNFQREEELGASLSVWAGGREMLRLERGWREREKVNVWDADTLAPVFSATKGPASATLLLALDRRGLTPSTPVREVWPGFPVAANFGQLLSHQCGLAALDSGPSCWRHAECVAAVEAQQPQWAVGSGHGYHPRSFGTLLEEPVRRLTGMSLGRFWRREIADPMELDFWIGLPEARFPRVARLYPGKITAGAKQDAFRRAFGNPESLTYRAFHSMQGLHAVREMNEPRAWAAGLPSMGGVGSASALAKFYQMAIGALPGPLPQPVRRWLAGPLIAGQDRVLLCPTAFSCGCQLDPPGLDGRKARELYGPSVESFGHSGAGGSHAFGDPRTGISFAYVMNRMETGLLPGARCLELVAAVFGG